jgi:predicted MFS family arabinose efflux permease
MRTGEIRELNPEQGKVYIREALRYIRARPDLKALMVITFFFATFGFNPELFSATMATMAFGKDAKEFGLLGSCIAIGSLSGSLLATKLEWKPGTRRVIACAIGFGFAIVIGSLAPSYTLYAIALPLFGAGMLTTSIAANRTAQLGSDPLIRGRVMGIYFAIFMGGTPIGAPVIGWLAEALGPRQALIISGLFVIFGALFVSWRFRGRLEPPADVSIEATFNKRIS